MAFGIKKNATDNLFSKLVRMKAKWICERCFKNCEGEKAYYDCSHFYSRKNRSVRFDFENAAALCRGCHFYFGEHPHEHSVFFWKRLGEEKFNALRVRAHTPVKNLDEKMLRIGFKMELKRLESLDDSTEN